MFLDLVGVETRARRAAMKVTVLKRPNGTWTRYEVGVLVSKLGNMPCITQLPRCPEYLVITDEHSLEKVQQILGCEDFEHKVVQGYDNPELPFKPQI